MSRRPLGERSMGCEFKALYMSEGEALAAIARREETSETHLYHYFCHLHGGWHLTSTPQVGQ